MSNKILVVGGVHGDEFTGIELAQKLLNDPIQDIGVELANPKAVQKRVRYVETDLNRSFGKVIPISYEETLAQAITAKLSNFELVLDFHNTDAVGTTCAILTAAPTVKQLGIIAYFGFEKIVIMPGSGSLIGQYPDRAISFEIADNNVEHFNLQYFIVKLQTLELTTIRSTILPSIYKFVANMPKKTAKRLNLNLGQLHNFSNFSTSQKEVLGLDSILQYCPIFLGCGSYRETAFQIVQID